MRDRLVPPLARIWPATRVQAEMVAGTFGGALRRLGLAEAAVDGGIPPAA